MRNDDFETHRPRCIVHSVVPKRLLRGWLEMGGRGRRDIKWAASDSVAPGAPPHPVINQTSCRLVLSIRSHSILAAVCFGVHSGRRWRRLISRFANGWRGIKYNGGPVRQLVVVIIIKYCNIVSRRGPPCGVSAKFAFPVAPLKPTSTARYHRFKIFVSPA